MPADRWQDTYRFFPYRDYQGRLVLFPYLTQKRCVVVDGGIVVQFREREETVDEIEARQW